MNVLITNAYTRMAYICARNLYHKGMTVYMGDYRQDAYSFYSKYVTGRVIYPSPYKEPIMFISTVIDFLKTHQPIFLLPTYEELFVFAKYIDQILPYTFCTIPVYENILKLHNKWELFKIAKSLNIKVPFTIPLQDILNSAINFNELIFPAVVKPRQGGGSWQINYVNNPKELSFLIEKLKAEKILDRMLFQEYVPATNKFSHAVIYSKGKRITYFTDLHVRDYPSTGGSGCCRISLKEPMIEKMGKSLFDAVRWHGVAELEAIQSKKTGEFYLLEVNPRIWGGVNSAISSGLNIPHLLYMIAKDGFSEVCEEYMIGVETRWLLGELRVIKDYLSTSRYPLKTAFHFIKGFMHPNCWDEIDIKDPLAMAHLFGMAFQQVIRRKAVAYEGLEGEWN
jgi:predicted ATP-grasp superfamily ATP-dependent carboligase